MKACLKEYELKLLEIQKANEEVMKQNLEITREMKKKNYHQEIIENIIFYFLRNHLFSNDKDVKKNSNSSTDYDPFNNSILTSFVSENQKEDYFKSVYLSLKKGLDPYNSSSNMFQNNSNMSRHQVNSNSNNSNDNNQSSGNNSKELVEENKIDKSFCKKRYLTRKQKRSESKEGELIDNFSQDNYDFRKNFMKNFPYEEKEDSD